MKEYSLRELVPEITRINYQEIGIPPSVFDADYKRIQRIYKQLRKIGEMGLADKKESIYDYEKVAMVNSLNSIFYDDRKYKFIKKIEKTNGFNPYEFDENEKTMFIEIFYYPFYDLEIKGFQPKKEEIRRYIDNVFDRKTTDRLKYQKTEIARILNTIAKVDSSKYRDELMDKIDDKFDEIADIIVEYKTLQRYIEELAKERSDWRYKIELEDLPLEYQKIYEEAISSIEYKKMQ